MNKQAKYGIYDYYSGQDCFWISNERPKCQELLENVSMIIDDENGILDVVGTKTFYMYFDNYTYNWWCDSFLDDLDLEGKKVEDFTEEKFKNVFHFIVGKKSKRIKNGTWLKKKETEPFHLRTSNWSINSK